MKECQHCLPCHLPKYYWPIDWGEILLANIVQEDIYHHLKASHKGSSQSTKLKNFTFSQTKNKNKLHPFLILLESFYVFVWVQRCSGLLWESHSEMVWWCLWIWPTFLPEIIPDENSPVFGDCKSENITADYPIGKN